MSKKRQNKVIITTKTIHFRSEVQTGSRTCAYIEVQNELYPFSNFGEYRITTLGKNDYLVVLEGKMVLMVFVLLLGDESQDRFDAFKISSDVCYI